MLPRPARAHSHGKARAGQRVRASGPRAGTLQTRLASVEAAEAAARGQAAELCGANWPPCRNRLTQPKSAPRRSSTGPESCAQSWTGRTRTPTRRGALAERLTVAQTERDQATKAAAWPGSSTRSRSNRPRCWPASRQCQRPATRPSRPERSQRPSDAQPLLMWCR